MLYLLRYKKAFLYFLSVFFLMSVGCSHWHISSHNDNIYVSFSEEHWGCWMCIWGASQQLKGGRIFWSKSFHLILAPTHDTASVRWGEWGRGRRLISRRRWNIVALKHLIRPVFTPCGAWAPALAGSTDVRCSPRVTEKQRQKQGGLFWGWAAVCGNMASHFETGGKIYSSHSIAIISEIFPS